jgi:hypothetical protein
LLKVEDQKVEIVNRDYFVNGSTYLFIIKIFKKRFVIKKLNILEIHQGQKKKNNSKKLFDRVGGFRLYYWRFI